jgi:hypothetical protein
MQNITKNVADTYKLMVEAAGKAVYSVHTFDTNEGHEHVGTFHNKDRADEHGSGTPVDIGHVVVKHHNGQVHAVSHEISDSLGKHAQEGMKRDAEEHAKKLKPEHLKPEEDD